MKRVLALSLVAMLGACSSTPPAHDAYTQRAAFEAERQTKSADLAVKNAPEWMSKLPKSPDAVYESGTASAADYAMADMMAKTIAYAKICIAAGGTVRQQTKMFGTENGMNMEMAVRSMCKDVDITGVETVEMKHVTEFGKIRSYALVALPIGNANTMRQAQDARLEKEGMKRTAKEAFKELDGIVDGKPAEAVRSEPQTINLLPVDNEEYKRKRDEALQKPGAVIGQTTVR